MRRKIRRDKASRGRSVGQWCRLVTRYKTEIREALAREGMDVKCLYIAVRSAKGARASRALTIEQLEQVLWLLNYKISPVGTIMGPGGSGVS